MFDVYDLRTLLDALYIAFTPKTFLLDTFFPTTEVSTTEKVDIDVWKGKRRMAPFVNPLSEGTPMDRIGYSTQEFEPPYLKPLRPITPKELLKRLPGENIFINPQTPLERLSILIGKDLAEMGDYIIRREEWMAAQLLVTGSVTVTGEGVNAVINCNRNTANTIVLSGTALWSNAASNVVQNFRDWKLQVTQLSGHVPTVAVMGAEVASTFMTNPGVLAILHNRRVQMGQIDPTDLPDGSSYLGSFDDVDIYGYAEWFIDDNGNEQPMIPVNQMVLGSPKTRAIRHYAAIQDLDAMGNPKFAQVSYYPKIWKKDNPSMYFDSLQCAPLPFTHEPDAFACIQPI
jgi:hypothetical protein